VENGCWKNREKRRTVEIEIIRKRVKSAWERDGSRKKAESGCKGGSGVDTLKEEERMVCGWWKEEERMVCGWWKEEERMVCGWWKEEERMVCGWWKEEERMVCGWWKEEERMECGWKKKQDRGEEDVRKDHEKEGKNNALKEEEKMECGYWKIRIRMKTGYMKKMFWKDRRKDSRKGQEKDGRMVSYVWGRGFQTDQERRGNTEGRGMDTRKMWKVVESGSMEGRGKDGGRQLGGCGEE
jgi:hypothetical protein